ncbi:MAG: NUDIX hydrolase [Candidatus Woesearchaeota archaeon]
MKTHLVVEGLLFHKGKLLLINHKKSGLWMGIGGHIAEDETPDQALKREFKEEMNLDIEILNRNDLPKNGNIIAQLALPFYVNVHNVGTHNHCCFFYLCSAKNLNRIKPRPSEIADFAWFSKQDLKQSRVPPDVRNIALKAFQLTEQNKRKS